jgi:hypothetical protein
MVKVETGLETLVQGSVALHQVITTPIVATVQIAVKIIMVVQVMVIMQVKAVALDRVITQAKEVVEA